MADLTESLRSCYKGAVVNGRAVRQEDIAEALGVRQSMVSKWMTGSVVPDVYTINAIERACERPLGWVLIKAGLVELPQSTRAAIAVDPLLDDHARRVILAAYDGIVGPQ